MQSLILKVARRGALLAMLVVGGCSKVHGTYVVPEEPMPANTVLLSQMMRDLSSKPGFTEAMLAELDKGGKRGPALLTPALVDHLRKMILGTDWQGLDRFPGWTMREINPTVRVVGHVAGQDEAVQGLAERHPGTPAGASPGTLSSVAVKAFVDLGNYSLDKAEVMSLDEPSRLAGFSTDGLVSELGAGVVRGDGANAELAPEHAESQRLADVLNRLSMNGVSGYAAAKVTVDGKEARSPEEMVGALTASGHTVEVNDARYFANFGHFHYKGQDVMMPFFVNSQIMVPGTKRPLMVPVSHAEYEWKVRGPKVNADVSWYFGIDGKAEFRTMDTQDQRWVMVRHAHSYRGADAVEVTRLVAKMTVAYIHQHVARPALPFGGYYALGVCQDSVAAIEKKMTGTATLFPNTADSSLFDDVRDAEVNALIAAIPKDRDGEMPGPERIFGSLPVGETELGTIMIPGLAEDLAAVHVAWRDGTLKRQRPWWSLGAMWGAVLVLGGLAVGVSLWTRRNPRVRR
jgi:hypothetical protein